ncbi:MAG: hypothetical protein FJX59_08735 [Alphaproteobacteria bacterium]|nr:hypothetical protein [Alphaproteobacteria bacterium]
MSRRILLLTDPELTAVSLGHLSAAARDAEICVVHDPANLAAEMAGPTPPERIIAFASGVIVPAETLAHLPGGAYGFHPGPANYRGLFPSAFALYDGATDFGVTLYKLTAEPDAGPIIAIDRFEVPEGSDRLALDTLTLKRMVALLTKLAGILTNLDLTAAPCGATWSGPVRRNSDFAALCRLPSDVTANEFERRYRAVGEGPFHALEIEIHGQRFKLDNRRTSDVVRAGQIKKRAA